MKNKKLQISDIAIDLTSLLDVIFIFLLVVMLYQNDVIDNTKETDKNLKKEIKNYEDKISDYDGMIDTINNINQYAWLVQISIPYETDNPERREIMVLANGEDEKSFILEGSDIEESKTNFENSIREYIEDKNGMPVIFSINDNDEKILYRDQNMIDDIIDKLYHDYRNVYSKGNSGEEE